MEADGRDDGIAAIEQLLKSVLVLGERLPGASKREHHVSAMMPTAGIDVVGRVHVLDVRGGEVVNEALRIAVKQSSSL